MTRPRNSRRARRICLDTHLKSDGRGEYMICNCGCCQRFDPTHEKWRADHNHRWAEGGEDTPENLWPILEACDREVKAPRDTREIAKGKRIRDARYGFKKSARPTEYTRLKHLFKRKVYGTVVPR